jgi:hypothetical protein
LGGKRFVARSVAWAITYLTLRTVLNSLRRLLASPLRALLALAIVGYLAYDEVSELLESSPDPETARLLLGGLSAQEQVRAWSRLPFSCTAGFWCFGWRLPHWMRRAA